MSLDLFNNINLKRGLSPVAATTDNTAYVSQILDMQGLDSAVFAILTGTFTDADATFTVLLEEGNQANLSDNSTVAATDMLGTAALASFTVANNNQIFKIGCRGSGKRYKRVTITPANNTGNVFIAGVWITKPQLGPTPNPPA